MPQIYNHAVMTDDGIRLLTKAQAGEINIQFTRMAAGDGAYTEEEKSPAALQKLKGLKSQKNSYALSSVQMASDNSVKLSALITNQDPSTGDALVTEGYYINEIGLYAREKGGGDSTEVLYSISVTAAENGDYMPPYNGHSPAQIVQEYYAAVSNSAEVSIDVDSMGAVLLTDGDASNVTVTFQQAAERAGVEPGDDLATAFGKLAKYCSDLADVAFSGNYSDLKGRPSNATAISAGFLSDADKRKLDGIDAGAQVNSITGVKGAAETSYRTGNVDITTENIGAAGVGELTSVWAAHGLSTAGWNRIAKCFFYGRDSSCMISVKRNWSSDSGESHKVQLMAVYSQAVFKSVYDKSHTKLISKIRAVKIENDIYIDVFYNSSSNNPCIFVIEDIMTSSANDRWKLLDSVQVVPETATGETVLATMDFEANSWIPDKYGDDNLPTLIKDSHDGRLEGLKYGASAITAQEIANGYACVWKSEVIDGKNVVGIRAITAAELVKFLGINKDRLEGWPDTRSTPTTPNDYNAAFKCVGIKFCSAVGLPGGNTYGTVFGVRGWTDASGGAALEVAIVGDDKKIYCRFGATTEWGAWYRIYSTADVPDMLRELIVTTGTDLSSRFNANYIGFVSGSMPFGQSNGALYKQYYDVSFEHQIFGDYRTGQIAVRGKNSGTWQDWRYILDSVNYTDYIPMMQPAGGADDGLAGLVPTPPEYGFSSGYIPSILTASGWSFIPIRKGSGAYSVILGRNNQGSVSGSDSVAFGSKVAVSGSNSIGGGNGLSVAGSNSIAIGMNVGTCENCQVQFGKCGATSTTNTFEKSIFSLGNGNVQNGVVTHSCAFRVAGNGTVYGQGAYQTGGADYAEYFEWEDGNPENEDRRGYFVTLVVDKIRMANPGDYIVGVVSSAPVVLGNSDTDGWKGRFLKDEFGKFILEDTEVEYTEPKEIEVEKTHTDEDGNEQTRIEIEIVEEIKTRMERTLVLNPEYDPELEYIERKDRPEWSPVGMVGQLIVRDDGTCEAGRYCGCGQNGVATLAMRRGFDTYMVAERIADNLIKIILK